MCCTPQVEEYAHSAGRTRRHGIANSRWTSSLNAAQQSSNDLWGLGEHMATDNCPSEASAPPKLQHEAAAGIDREDMPLIGCHSAA
mmetsp:Transcript_47119/g.86447  ORF Transcript_47119/g.86447 Transcript_47119/m.86447 type:complete len:86 (-) Transcript_47119:7-264(-)